MPGWFQVIWDVVKPMLDESIIKTVTILSDKDESLKALQEKIPIENIPPVYGGTSMPLGESPQEELLRDLMKHNNEVNKVVESNNSEEDDEGKEDGDNSQLSCGGRDGGCKFCSFVPVRSY